MLRDPRNARSKYAKNYIPSFERRVYSELKPAAGIPSMAGAGLGEACLLRSRAWPLRRLDASDIRIALRSEAAGNSKTKGQRPHPWTAKGAAPSEKGKVNCANAEIGAPGGFSGGLGLFVFLPSRRPALLMPVRTPPQRVESDQRLSWVAGSTTARKAYSGGGALSSEVMGWPKRVMSDE